MAHFKLTFFWDPSVYMLTTSDTRSVNLVVDLPEDLAEDIEDVKQEDPEFIGRAIQYALARRIIFEELVASSDAG